jgi:hypothetical protein
MNQLRSRRSTREEAELSRHRPRMPEHSRPHRKRHGRGSRVVLFGWYGCGRTSDLSARTCRQVTDDRGTRRVEDRGGTYSVCGIGAWSVGSRLSQARFRTSIGVVLDKVGAAASRGLWSRTGLEHRSQVRTSDGKEWFAHEKSPTRRLRLGVIATRTLPAGGSEPLI